VVPPLCDAQVALDQIDAELLSDMDSLSGVYPYATAIYQLDRYTWWQRYHYYLNKIKKDYISAASNSRVSILNTYRNCIFGSGAWSYTAASPELKALINLKRNNVVGLRIESTYNRGGNVIGTQSLKYGDPNGDGIRIYPTELDLVNPSAAIDTTTFIPISFGNTSVLRDSRYQLEETYDFFLGNICRITPKSGIITSYIWNNAGVYPIAQIQNAVASDCSFTSFEDAQGAGEGGWLFTFTNGTESKTGAKGHVLYNNSISKGGLTTSTTYTLSYWAKGGVPSVSAGVVSNNDASAAESDGWRYFEKTISGVAAFTISGTSGVYLDELRLYPKTARMTTYTHLPLVGIMSITDHNNRRTHFDYDPLTRLKRIRDSDRNIMKQYQYNYRVTIP